MQPQCFLGVNYLGFDLISVQEPWILQAAAKAKDIMAEATRIHPQAVMRMVRRSFSPVMFVMACKREKSISRKALAMSSPGHQRHALQFCRSQVLTWSCALADCSFTLLLESP